jgi:hypothetical protein
MPEYPDLSDATLDGPAAGAKTPPRADFSTPRGFPDLPCLRCGEVNRVFIDLEDMSFRCDDCEATWEAREAAYTVARWQAVLAWVAQAPPSRP